MHVGIERFDIMIRSYPKHWFSSPNLFGVEAAVAAWTEGDGWLAAVMDVLDENRHRLAELVETFAGSEVSDSECDISRMDRLFDAW